MVLDIFTNQSWFTFHNFLLFAKMSQKAHQATIGAKWPTRFREYFWIFASLCFYFRIPFKSAVVVNVLAPRTEATTIEFSDCPPKYEDLEKNLVAVISTKNNNLPPSYEEALNKIEVNWECIWVIMMHWWHDGFYIKYNDGLTAKRETKRF